MIQLDKLAFKEITAVFIFAFLLGALIFGWFEWKGIPISNWPTGVDIYPRWVGTKAFWRGESPYSAEVDLETQSYLYGRPAEADEDPMGFYYPAHAAIVLTPITFLPARWSALLWTTSMWAIVAVFIFAIIKNMPGPTSFKLLFFIAISIFLYRPAIITVINGQYSIFILTLWGLAYLLIRREQDILAGFILSLTTIKPSLSFFPLIVFLLWTLKNKRFKVSFSVLITCGVFFIITLIQLGWWVPEFLGELAEYDVFPRSWGMSDIFTWSGIIWLSLTMFLLYLGYKDLLREKANFPWTLFWGAISLNLLLTPHTAEYDLMIIVLPFIILAPKLFQSKKGILAWIIVMWLPWLYYFILEPIFKLARLYAYYPTIIVIILLFLYFEERRHLKTSLETLPNTNLSPTPIAPIEIEKE